MKLLANFSAGAASAYATALAIEKYGVENVLIINMPVANEHPDNERFVKECEDKLFKKEVVKLRSKKFPTMDIFDVFTANGKNKKPFFKSPAGAPCTTQLKRFVRDDFLKSPHKYIDGEIHELDQFTKHQVFGFTVEEKHRHDRLVGNLYHPSCTSATPISPLIEENKTKDDCLQFLNVKGIEIPAMYRLGFNNNNCIGCVKGGKGYWNHIRKKFPEVFEKMAKMERVANYSLFDVFLDELPPTAGIHNEPMTDCDILCMLDKEKEQEKFFCDD